MVMIKANQTHLIQKLDLSRELQYKWHKWVKPFSAADQTSSCTNSIHPDDTLRNKPSHQDLHSSPLCF